MNHGVLRTSFILALMPSAVFAIGDTEPNDTLDTAVPTGLIDGGTVHVFAGAIGDGPLGYADRDIYAIDVSPDADLPVTLTATIDAADNYDAYMRVFDDQGLDIAFGDDASGEDLNPTVRTYLLAPGTYFIGVSHSMNPGYDPGDDETGRPAELGTYDLDITLSPAPAIDSSLEPNDDQPVIVDAEPFFALHQFIGDGPNLRLDVDRYAITLAGPSIVRAVAADAGDGSFDPVLTITVDGTTFLATDRPRADSMAQEIAFAVPDASTIEVAVRGTHNAPDPPELRYGDVGFYDLVIAVTPVTTGGGPYEPNDSLLEAVAGGSGGPGSTTIAAVIGDGVYGHTRGDVDFFNVFLAVDERLDVTVQPSDDEQALDPVVHLFGFTGEHLDSWIADGDGVVRASFVRYCQTPEPCKEGDQYVVAIMGAGDRLTTDPLIPNPFSTIGEPPDTLYAVDGGFGSTGAYEATFTIDPYPSPIPAPPIEPTAHAAGDVHTETPTPTPIGSTTALDRVFAVQLDAHADSIVELDPTTGDFVNAFAAPESPMGGAEGLAFDGTDLFLVGSGGRYPILYRLNADTGDVLDSTNTWFGSGTYGDIAFVKGDLYITDILDNAIFALSTSFDEPARTLDVGLVNSFSLSGAIATLASPNRLVVADSRIQNPLSLHILDIDTGNELSTATATAPCPCDADFDGDGDVDDDDWDFFRLCDYDGSGQCSFPVTLGCERADLDCSGFICGSSGSESDWDIFACQRNGPGVPPNPGCCPDDLSAAIRATSIAGTGVNTLLAADWTKQGVWKLDLSGSLAVELSTLAPIGTMAGLPRVSGDADADGDVDLIDWSLLQSCFTGPGLPSSATDACSALDFDEDNDVDTYDFTIFHSIITGSGS